MKSEVMWESPREHRFIEQLPGASRSEVAFDEEESIVLTSTRSPRIRCTSFASPLARLAVVLAAALCAGATYTTVRAEFANPYGGGGHHRQQELQERARAGSELCPPGRGRLPALRARGARLQSRQRDRPARCLPGRDGGHLRQRAQPPGQGMALSAPAPGFRRGGVLLRARRARTQGQAWLPAAGGRGIPTASR